MPSSTERKVLFHTWYQGREYVEVVGNAVIYGKTYYEIRFEDGKTKTVPASMCKTNFVNEEKGN